MGFDKQFLKLNNQNMMSIIIEELEKEFTEIIIVSNKPDEYMDSDHIIVSDIIKDKGPLSGIHAGLYNSSSDYNFVIGCDMPNINLDYIRYMKDLLEDGQYSGSVTKYMDWIEPFYSFYSKDLIDSIEDYLERDRKAIYPFLKDENILYIEESKAKEFSPDWSIFENLNTLKDLDRYRSKINI